jgi:hypothetical protein
MFTGSKPVAAAAAPGAAAASPASPRVSKKKSARPPRVYDDAAKCRIKKYESYRTTCSADEKKQKESCEMVKKCKQHGVGSELWPVDVWHLEDDKFKAVNEKFKDPSKPNEWPVVSGKRCMNEVMRADAKFVKEIETECGPLEKKKSVKAPVVAAAAAPKVASVKPKVASVKPKVASVKPKVASAKPKVASAKPKVATAPVKK